MKECMYYVSAVVLYVSDQCETLEVSNYFNDLLAGLLVDFVISQRLKHNMHAIL